MYKNMYHLKIKGFENYNIYPDGTVINNITNKIKQPCLIRKYNYVDLYNNGKRKNLRLGRLLAEHYIPNPKNLPQVNHIDGNKLNDNIQNLEWITISDNLKHKTKIHKELGIYKSPKGRMKFTRNKIDKVKILKEKGLKHKEIASKLNMAVSTVTHILLGSRRANQ